MDLERLLVSKLVYTGQVEEALARLIDDRHFADDECRELWRFLVRHTRKYKSSPTLDAVRLDFSNFEFLQTQETLEWVLDRFTVHVKRRFADEYLIELGKSCDDPAKYEDIDLEFLRVSQDLIQSMPTGKVSRFKAEIEQRIKEYEERRKTGKRLGIPYGLPTLDRKLGGIFPHELVTVLGFTNIGKSHLLRVLAFNIWAQGYTPLYVSLEMGADEILRELDAMAAKLDRQKFKQLDLSEHDLESWQALAERVHDSDSEIPIIDPSHRVSPDYVYAETLRHRPHIVLIDYIGLMRPNGALPRGTKRYQTFSDITQELKLNARRLRIPVIMAAQTNRAAAREGAELDNVADSIGIAQDSDTVIGLHQDETMERAKEMEIRVNKSRSGPRPRFKMIWDHEMPEFREKTMRDVMFHRNDSEREAAVATGAE